jgi:hypothetical protein
MHRVRHLGKIYVLLVLYIGSFCCVLNAAAPEPDLEQLEKEKKVYVEPSFVQYVKTQNEYKLETYKERRHAWGFTGSAGYSTYEPVNYEPSFAKTAYNQVYAKPAIGMVEGSFTAKRNLSAFSVGVELGAGSFNNDHTDPNFVGSKLNLTEIHVGGVIFLDTIYADEPMFVPYLSGGGYVMIFKESLDGNAFGGTTQIAPYVNGGVAMQLDWLDRRAARIGYEESGVLTSYLYLEARKYFTSQVKKDPDFSNTVSGVLGVRVEF